MRSNYLKTLKTAVLAISVLLLGVSVSFAQQQINLNAGPANATLPDGSLIPMWGYSCGAAVLNSSASCAALNPHANGGWSPVVITIPTGQDLQINLTNNLSFTPTGGGTANPVPTSIVIVGQLGGGLGTPGGYTNAPDHSGAQTVTWPIADPTTAGNPPRQNSRVQSFGAEVPALTTTSLCWGVCGTSAPALKPGTYLIESGTHPSIQGPMGLYGILVVTTVPAGATAGTAYPAVGTTPAVNYNSEVPLLLSEIDPVQNNAVQAAVTAAGFKEDTVWSGQPGKCGDPAAATHPCYPPAVNYTPLYYLINGVAFNVNSANGSLFPATAGVNGTVPVTTGISGNVLVRLVNAGLRMHVPSIVGAQNGTAPGFGLMAEDGNPLPGVTRVQSEVFMAAGKTYDVMMNVPAGTLALPIYDRELSLSANATARDGGMLAYISVNGSGLPNSGAFAPATAAAFADIYNALVGGQKFTVSDPLRGVIANDVNVYGVQLLTQATNGSVVLNANGTFTYTPSGTGTSDSFTYCANGSVTGTTCSSGLTATVTLGAETVVGGITCSASAFTASTASYLAIKTPGVLANCTDSAGLPLTIDTSKSVGVPSGVTVVTVDANGGFALTATGPGTYALTFPVQNSSKTPATATANVTFPAANGPTVTVLDGADKKTVISDYRWVIEEDRTFYVDPKCTQNPLPAGCPTVTPQGAPAAFGTNFHTSWMPLVATGCTGTLSCEGGQTQQGATVVCDQGNGACRPDASGNGFTTVDPRQVHLDPNKRYYISVLPGDAANPFIAGYAGAPDCTPAGVAAGSCGHGMGGAPFVSGQAAVTVFTQPSPYPPAKLSVFVFEDDWPLNGEHDAGGGVDVLAPQEAGLGGFQITLFDDAGGTGDATGQPTYDMFNMPLTNSLAGTIDPISGLDACPVSKQVTSNVQQSGDNATADQCSNDPTLKGCQKGIVGMIVTCPRYESDGVTLSPLAGEAVVNNLYQGRYGVVANPSADRIARGEEWLQTNTLDGQKAHDSFMRIGEPAYFQEFGPAGYHVSIGFANPAIINSRKTCTRSVPCNKEVKGHVTTARMSRPPDERLYGSGSRDSFSFTQCYASLGDPDGAEFAFAKCDSDGNFDFKQVPAGNWKLTVFDQWNDQIVDGISTPVGLAANATVLDMGEIATHQWQANIYTRSFIDNNGDGVSNVDGSGNPTEPGLALVATNIRFRDGSFSNFNNTDLNGFAGFNEVFPLFSWYVIETDSTRYKTTGVHVVYDAGGPTDGTTGGGSSGIGQYFANTIETNSLPANLRVPGARYCASADCPPGDNTGGSTGRVDPPLWFGSYGWQGFAGQNSFLEFGKKPYMEGENGGIHGHVVYASTRPFDDPQLLLQLSWEPLVPHVKVNLYREDLAADGVTQTLTLVDHTETSSFDDWAQGFRTDAAGNILKDAAGNAIPNMNCPGQSTTDIFFYGLQNQPNYLDWYNSQHGGASVSSLPNNSQFKCYDGMHNWNQLQPAPYDGMYSFPSVTRFDPATGKPAGTNCTGCTTNPSSSDPANPTYDPYRAGAPMLPAGKYVVEIVVPPGYELVKEEDKNILIGDNYIAPAVQEFGGLGSIYIMPDQASVAATYNSTNALNPTTDLGVVPRHEGDTGSVETFWPCVGAARTVPDFISLFPGSGENAPFAGAMRNLCDRKEITLTDQTSALAKFYIFTSTHIASHYTGLITDDFTAEFDPFSPQFGEKFAPAYLPVSIKDWSGNEVSRTYADQFGAYTGLNYSTWEVNPPNPTGYGPTMMVTCMNDPGTGATPDPLYQPAYSAFCYELPFMPGQTGYFDTPVVPVSAFAEGFNHPDCNYPDATPGIASVISSDIAGPWVAGTASTLTITSLGNVLVDSYGYSGPSITTPPYNQQKVSRNYGFGTTQGTVALVGSDGVSRALTGVTWNNTTITGHVPNNVPNCAVTQQTQYGGSAARCGELVITTAAGKMSVDTVTVTIGGKKPTVLAAGKTIQSALDAAAPGDMIIVPPGVYNEMLLMWKPVRLQGVGAASSIINADPHPAGRLDPWRKEVVCLFGLTTDGRPSGGSYPGCPGAGWTNLPQANASFKSMIVDRVTLEAILGWDANLNGNLAEQLIEPSLMGAYEGAAITVLGKGVNIPANAADPFGTSTATPASFPDGTTLLTASNCTTGRNGGPNPYPSNFYCNPSSIDGLTLKNSSQGGGGIFVHAWGHNIQIGNNRVQSNNGSLSGGITVGQGEHVDVILAGVTPPLDPPNSCENSNTANVGLPFCYNTHVNVHHNAVTNNTSMGDELFSSTPAGAGGVSFCNGADYYSFNNNWVCGNMSTGDGGGVAHIGFIKNGDIEHNVIAFNQSTNPTITTNGGGLLVMGAPDLDPPCSTNDQDCVPAPGSVAPGDGTGPGLVINGNLIIGNAADSGSGGGLRLQHVNGTDVLNWPNGTQCDATLTNATCHWNTVRVTNNIIANNVAGWDGGGVSLQDSLAVNLVNNTIVSNDSTASSGVLFGSLFAPLASAPGVNCNQPGNTKSCPQVAGVVSVTNGAILQANLPASGFSCPVNHGAADSCRNYSVPFLTNNVIWQNRSFFIGVTAPSGSGTTGQQSTVGLFNAFSGTPAVSQPSAPAIAANGGGTIVTGGTGACTPGASYWDIGVRGDTGPSSHVVIGGSTLQLFPQHSIITDASDYPSASNLGSDPTVLSEYCNGSRVPPELKSMGFEVPPGTNETNALPTPVFSLTPSATVDEGNNWINLRWGPLAMSNPTTPNVALGNYSIAAGSPAIDTADSAFAPSTDYFGHTRPQGAEPDMGAVEFLAANAADLDMSPSAVDFGSVTINLTPATAPVRTVTLSNPGTANLTVTGIAVTGTGFSRVGGSCPTIVPFVRTPGQSCTITVSFRPTAVAASQGALTVTSNDASPDAAQDRTVPLTGTGTRLRISPNPVNFLVVAGGGFSPYTTVTVTNIAAAGGGSTGAITVSQPINVTNGVTFQVAAPLSGTSCLASPNLGPQQSCTFRVRFQSPTPLTAGTGTVNVSDTEPAQVSVTLNGTRLF